MNFRKHAALPLIALALTLPVMAQANSLYHPADTDAGYTEHPDHWKSTKTRAQVMAEVEAARKDGTLALMQRNAPPPMKATGRKTATSERVVASTARPISFVPLIAAAFAGCEDREEAFRDLFWVVLNTKEFAFNH